MSPDSDSSDNNAGFHFSVSHFVLNRSFERSCSDIRSLLTPGLGVCLVARLHHQILLSADDPFANSTTLPGNIKSTVSRPSLASVVESIRDAHPPQTSASAARDYTPLLDGEGCPHQAEASPLHPRRSYATGATTEEQEIHYLKYQRPPSKTKHNGKRVRPPSTTFRPAPRLHALSQCAAPSSSTGLRPIHSLRLQTRTTLRFPRGQTPQPLGDPALQRHGRPTRSLRLLLRLAL